MSQMKLALLIEAIDKATGPLRDISARVNSLGGTAAGSAGKIDGLGGAATGLTNKTGHLGETATETTARIDSLGGAALRTAANADTLGGKLEKAARSGSFARLSAQAGAFGNRMGTLINSAESLALKLGALTGIGAFVFKNQFIDTAADFETLSVSLASVEGDATKAKRAMDWLTDFAKKTPLTLAATTEAYKKLKFAGLDPTNGSLQALVDISAKAGSSQEKTIGAITQFAQAWMLGKLQMEDAHTIMDNGIPIIKLMADAYGTSTDKVMEAMSKGKIGHKSMLRVLTEMEKQAKGASEAQSKTWQGMTSTLSDNWDLVKRNVMDAGPFDFLKGKLKALNDWLEQAQTPGGMTRSQEWGKNLVQGFEKIEKVGKRVWGFLEGLAGMFGWENVLLTGLGGIAAMLAGPFVMATALATAAFASLSLALLINPWTWIIAGIAAAAYAIYSNWDGIVATVKSAVDATKLAFVTMGQNITATWDGMVLGVSDGIESIVRFVVGLADRVTGIWDGMIGSLSSAWKGFTGLFGLGGGMPPMTIAPKAPTLAPALPSLGSPAPTLRGNAATAPRADVGGRIHIKIDSEGRPKIQSMASHNKNVPIDIDAGLMGAAA
jgi:tape measure domain-containing protein